MLPGRDGESTPICRTCAEITTKLTCDECAREAERFRKGRCMRCVLRSDLTARLHPNDPPDLRLHRLIRALVEVERPESIYTWLRNPAVLDVLDVIGKRELDLTHEAFNALPSNPTVEHIRAILTYHGILPEASIRYLEVFENWLDRRLDELSTIPEVHSPVERFGRWHHLRRLKEQTSASKNMNYAARNAKQEITEAGKFLIWLWTEHRRTASTMNQAHLDEYLSEGTSTRKHVRNFVQYLKREKSQKGVYVPYRLAKSTPLLTRRDRIALIKKVMEDAEGLTSTRVAALIFLLYGTPIGRISMLTLDCLHTDPTGMTISIGKTPAPIPDVLVPLFWEHLRSREGQQTTNSGTNWLFPGARAGRPFSPESLLQNIRDMGIAIQGTRNQTLRGLVEELDPTSLASLTGYAPLTLSRHATAATVPWSSYVTDKTPRFAKERPTEDEV